MERDSVVCGQFYPRNTKELERLIATLTPEGQKQIQARGLILPHAGYVYSGKVACAALNCTSPKKRIVILGPNHTGYGECFSLYAQGKWKFPWGNVSIDEEIAQKLLEGTRYIKEDILAHQQEHSLEVEIPLLWHFFSSDFTIVPIVCARNTLTAYRGVAEEIVTAIKGIENEVLIVASSDLTHYEPDAQARRKDRLAIDSIINLDEEKLLAVVEKEKISMCGSAPVAILLACMKKLGALKAQVVLYQTSGDASGDYSSVVGYVGIVIN